MLNDISEATRHAQSLAAAGRPEDAIALHRRIVAAFPDSAVAFHNLASCLGDAGYWSEAEPQIRRALSLGLDAAETWLVLGRCMQALARLDEAERAFVNAVERAPLALAHRELVQLRWMRGGDISAALIDLDAALRDAPNASALVMARAQALAEAGQTQAALAFLLPAANGAPQDGELAALVSQLALAEGDEPSAKRYASRAIQYAPHLPASHWAMIESLLAGGEFEAASAAAATFLRAAPRNQQAIALQATAWRALGDPRYEDLYAYDDFLVDDWLDAPPGWSSRDAFVADLREELNLAHPYVAHPFAQALRHGSLRQNILHLPQPAVRALPAALDGPIRRYLKRIGSGSDPLRAFNSGNYAYHSVWSVRMEAGGHHTNHVHAFSWVSAAFYLERPEELAGREGWIKFGEPGLRVAPPQAPERYMEPIPGRILLFPSYMWHGTIPFSSRGSRLTVAFDLVPH